MHDHDPAFRLRTSTLFTILTRTIAVYARLRSFKESPGLYYDHVGEAELCNTEWRLLTYIDLLEAGQNLETKEVGPIIYLLCKSQEHAYWINLLITRKLLTI